MAHNIFEKGDKVRYISHGIKDYPGDWSGESPNYAGEDGYQLGEIHTIVETSHSNVRTNKEGSQWWVSHCHFEKVDNRIFIKDDVDLKDIFKDGEQLDDDAEGAEKAGEEKILEEYADVCDLCQRSSYLETVPVVSGSLMLCRDCIRLVNAY